MEERERGAEFEHHEETVGNGMTNKTLFILLPVLFLGVRLASQEKEQNISPEREDFSLNSQLALSSPDYQVTAGDIYTLSYAVGDVPVTYNIIVDSSYRVRISNLGLISVAGKTFRQLKTEAENIVSNNYPLSGVQLVLLQPATFRVRIKGEVWETKEVSTWALARLSSLTDNLTPYASVRNVSVKSGNGQVKTYDLFKAERYGDMTQDPYLRPGDIVTFNRAERQVMLTGAVERPNTYQLLPGENLRELIDVYGSGFTPIADPTRIEVTRYVNSSAVSGNKILPGENGYQEDFHLEHYDMVMVPEKTQLRPVVFVEGAVEMFQEEDGGLQSSPAAASVPTASNRLVVPFNKGEHYASLVRRNSKWFSAVSDTRNAYIVRGEGRIPINLNPLLYDETYRGEILIEDNDTLIIPFRQYFVTVAGAVVNPGRYPYIPDRRWDYYIALAGGFMPERNRGESIVMTDIQGKSLKKTDYITPETVITARTNHGLYYFTRYAPVITAVLSITGTTISIIALARR